jgi:hypothetical protein
MAKKQQNELKAAQAKSIKSQAISLILKESFPYFKCTCWLVGVCLVGPTGITAAKNILKLFGAP